MQPTLIEVKIACPTKENAQTIGKEMVEKQLAACAQIEGPIDSIYVWKEQTEKTSEWICTLKTNSLNFLEIVNQVEALHQYDVPQITGTEIAFANPDYADWVWKNSGGRVRKG